MVTSRWTGSTRSTAERQRREGIREATDVGRRIPARGGHARGSCHRPKDCVRWALMRCDVTDRGKFPDAAS